MKYQRQIKEFSRWLKPKFKKFLKYADTIIKETLNESDVECKIKYVDKTYDYIIRTYFLKST